MTIKIRSMTVVVAGSILTCWLSVQAQTTEPDESPTAIPPEFTITIDPNELPEGATPSPTQPSRCGPHRALSVAWNRDGTRMAVGIGSGTGTSNCVCRGAVLIFDMTPERPQLLHTLTHAKDLVPSVDYSPDGSHLAVGDFDQKVRIYNTVNPSEPLHTLTHATCQVRSVGYSPDGSRLAVGGDDQKVRIYRVGTEAGT